MTTSVLISAHHAATKEVKITITGKDMKKEEVHSLQDGEKMELYVYDDRQITVREVEK